MFLFFYVKRENLKDIKPFKMISMCAHRLWSVLKLFELIMLETHLEAACFSRLHPSGIYLVACLNA